MALLAAPQLLVIFGCLSVVYALAVYRRYRKLLESIDDFPGVRTLLSPASKISPFLPPIPGINLGRDFRWDNKYKTFQEAGWDIYAHVSAWPDKRVGYSLADAEAIKEMALNRAVFPKPQIRLIEIYGPNVVTTEDEEWKRHRKVSAPAFSERNNKLVWQETVRIVNEIFAEWGDKDAVSIPHIVDVTLPIALLVISAAGFGRRISWREETDAKPPPGHALTFKQSITTVCNNLFLKVLLPEWIMGLTSKWSRVRQGFYELEAYMGEMIEERQKNLGQPADDADHNKSDLFHSLLVASEAEAASGAPALTPRELMGNIFIFLLAGHETTAHALAFSFGLLACYPDEQQKLYDHITSVVSGGRLPSYEDMHSLTRPLAVMYEALRLFPPVLGPMKKAAQDTTLFTYPASQGNTKGASPEQDQRRPVIIPKGSIVSIHVAGLHYNPRYWENPYAFKPDRFLGNYNKDAFAPFAIGPRACLGRRFSETEAVAVITMIVLRYKIELNPSLFTIIPGESPDATRERLLKAHQVLTMAPANLPLLFRRRA